MPTRSSFATLAAWGATMVASLATTRLALATRVGAEHAHHSISGEADSTPFGPPPTALVEVIAGDYVDITGMPLRNYTILTFINTYDVNEAQTHCTGDDGFLRLQLPVGARVFFNLVGTADYTDTTSSVVTVPPQGLSGYRNRIVMQVPSFVIYGLFKALVPRTIEPNTCQTVVTITQFGVSYNDVPQGWLGAKAVISPANYVDPSNTNTVPFYFGTWGPFSNLTNPFPNNLTSTSWDGGVLFANIPVNPNADFVISGAYQDYNYSTSTFRCLKAGQFLNAAPPQGPHPNKLITDPSGLVPPPPPRAARTRNL